MNGTYTLKFMHRAIVSVLKIIILISVPPSKMPFLYEVLAAINLLVKCVFLDFFLNGICLLIVHIN